jgi:acetyl-CoA carboxylase carboxyltransferase component
LTARERIALLADPETFFELGQYTAHGMYEEWGGAPAAGVITGLARIETRMVMIIANDATVKAGAFFPMTSKKVIRAQNIAIENRIPTVYLVDSAGVFLPLQEDVFPDTDDFGRVFRNNAVMSAMGIPQIAAIMGMCVAGGGYLPVMCDHVLMTDGSGLFLAGPALVQAAIGQKVSADELAGRRCTPPSAARLTFANRTIRLVWRASGRSWRNGDTGGFLPGIGKSQSSRCWPRKKSTESTTRRRRGLTT